MTAMLSTRKTLLSVAIVMSCGAASATEVVGVSSQAEAGLQTETGLRSQIESESRAMLQAGGALGARTTARAKGNASIETGSEQAGGSTSGEARFDAHTEASVGAEARGDAPRISLRGLRATWVPRWRAPSTPVSVSALSSPNQSMRKSPVQ
jgi:hypothetical protein